MGLKHREIADELSIKYQVSKNCLHGLKDRNAREVGGKQVWPSTMELIQRAEELELLNPYAIKGLESILENI